MFNQIFSPKLIRCLALSLLLTLLTKSGWAEEIAPPPPPVSSPAPESLSQRFGFAGKEIFPIDHFIGHLRAADLNGDGLQDLVIVNNIRSKINLLYNQTGQTNSASASIQAVRHQINELPPGARFKIESISSEKRISSLAVADLNGDGRPDIAYYGEPKELVVHFNEGNKTWSAPKRWPIDDGLLNQNALVHGDLNGDGRADLLLLAEGHVYWLAQNENKTLSEPEKIPYTGTVQAVQVLDIQGDGRDDLLLVNWDSPNPFRFRLQTASNQLGPEIHFTLPPIRSYWADDLDGDRKTEVITIAHKSGRAQISHFTETAPEALSGEWRKGQFHILPLNRTGRAKRGLIWADINADNLPDLLVAEPDAGQLTVFVQQPDGTLAAAKTFPSFTGVSELAVADWDGDGFPEIFALSVDERQIGVTRLDQNGRIPFPKLLPIEGRPLSMTVGRIGAESAPVLAMIVDLDGKRELHLRDAEGEVKKTKLTESFKSNPRALAIHDINQDGRPDLLVLIPYEKIKILLQTELHQFEEIDIAPPGGSAEQPWFSTADLDGDGKEELLLAQKNFLRAVVLETHRDSAGSKTNWSFQVKEQINGAASNSRIVGAAPLKQDNAEFPSLFLLDAERKSLTLCQRDSSGIWNVTRNVPLSTTDFQSIQATGVGGTNSNSIAFLGNNTVAWMTFHGKVWEFTELDSYETPVRDGFLHDVVSGDLNQDGRKDLVFLETRKSHIDVVTFQAPHHLVPTDRWQVFEERTFRRRTEAPEPREALIADFNKDGKNDLIVVVHDRIILYPQE